jgi:RNA polymerase sigma-70 factor (ECF subfamily)
MGMADTDQELFTLRWMQAQPVVASVLMAMLRDPSAVDDLLQETAVTAYQEISAYDQTRPFTAWAVGIARHKAMHWFRSRNRRPQQPLSENDLDRLAAAAESQAGELDARALRLHQCLERLSGRAAQAIEMHYAQDLPQATVAERLKMGIGALRVLLYRARTQLRTCIEGRAGSAA